MRELNFVKPGELEWRDGADAKLQGDGEAVVRPLSVATCDLDTALIGGRVSYRGPFAFGHECVAEVVEAGDGVSSFAPGDLVSVAFQIFCGECAACREGRSASCTTTPPMATYGLPLGGDWGGFLSDSVRVPYAEAMMVSLPEGVERVDYVRGRPGSAHLAGTLGANVIEGPFPERLGPYPITVDASADPEGLACALRSTEPDGICTSVGTYYEPETPVPLLEMYTKGITFRTRPRPRRAGDPRGAPPDRRRALRPESRHPPLRRLGRRPEALSSELVKTVISR